MTNKQKGFSIIELLIVFGFMGLIMMLMILAMEHVQNNSSIVDEKNFLDNFFNNINNDDLSNQTLFKEANNTTKMNLKTSNQPLSKDTLNSLYQIGLFTQSHTVNENGSLNSSLGPTIIYPYGLNDKMNGKLTVLSTNNSNKKEAVSTRFYTVSYPLVEEDKCAAFLNFIQKSSS